MGFVFSSFNIRKVLPFLWKSDFKNKNPVTQKKPKRSYVMSLIFKLRKFTYNKEAKIR